MTEEESVSPTVAKIQKLEKRIDKLSQENFHLEVLIEENIIGRLEKLETNTDDLMRLYKSLKERIDVRQNDQSTLEGFIKLYSERLEILEKTVSESDKRFKIHFDEFNRFISKLFERMDEAEQDININSYKFNNKIINHSDKFELIFEDLEKLESFRLSYFEQFKIDHDERLEKLESNDEYNKRYSIELHEYLIKSDENIAELSKFIIAHEEFLKKIDTIALCDPEKVAANQKILLERLEKLETYMEMEDRVTASHVINILTKLEEHKNYQIDENRKISQRVDEIESYYNPIKHNELVSGELVIDCPTCNGSGKVGNY